MGGSFVPRALLAASQFGSYPLYHRSLTEPEAERRRPAFLPCGRPTSERQNPRH